VCLSNMQKEENQCPELTETTAEALRDNTVLAKLFIITSRNNTAIRRKMCIQEHVRVRLLEHDVTEFSEEKMIQCLWNFWEGTERVVFRRYSYHHSANKQICMQLPVHDFKCIKHNINANKHQVEVLFWLFSVSWLCRVLKKM